MGLNPLQATGSLLLSSAPVILLLVQSSALGWFPASPSTPPILCADPSPMPLFSLHYHPYLLLLPLPLYLLQRVICDYSCHFLFSHLLLNSSNQAFIATTLWKQLLPDSLTALVLPRLIITPRFSLFDIGGHSFPFETISLHSSQFPSSLHSPCYLKECTFSVSFTL